MVSLTRLPRKYKFSLWRGGVVVIITAQLHSTKSELRFYTGANPARGVSETRDGEDLWQWSRLKIRLNVFRRSTIPQKQFITIRIIIIAEIAQNNSVLVFAWKTSNNSRERPNLKINMNQVTNLKSLGEKIANLQGVSTCFWSSYFCNRPFCGRRCYKTSISISCCESRWFTCTNPMKLSIFT